VTPDNRIACSLGADELPKRLAEISAVGRDALLSATPDGELRFRADETIGRRLEAIIAAESRCCSFLSFQLRDHAGELVLSIAAPEAAAPVASDLVSAFAAEVKAA
jgi:hypothetical protein